MPGADPLDDWRGTPAIRSAQRRAMAVLLIAQILGGLGIGAGIAVGSLLAVEVAGTESLAGVARTMSTIGSALFAVPLVLLAARVGRRGALGVGWLTAGVGGVGLVTALTTGSFWVLIIGMLLFGAGQAASLQSRFAATDLARPATRGRSLSVIVWATTVGSVFGPNLVGPGAVVGGWFGLSALAGPYLIGVIGLLSAGIACWVGLRPDPLLLAASREGVHEDRSRPRISFTSVLAEIARRPRLRTGVVVVVLNHTVMVTVMTMAPVHMEHQSMALVLIGLTLSLHTLGMFAFSPLVGIVSDRLGELPTIGIGMAVNLLALAVCFTAGRSMIGITVGMFALGLGWSFTMVAGSTLIGHAAPNPIRPQVQGVSDTMMNLVAALGAGIAGPVMAGWGYEWLSVVAAGVVLAAVAVLMTSGGRAADVVG